MPIIAEAVITVTAVAADVPVLAPVPAHVQEVAVPDAQEKIFMVPSYTRKTFTMC